MREKVRVFAEEMEKVLKENDSFKDGWGTCDAIYLYCQLKSEVEELKELMESKIIDQIDNQNSMQNCTENIQKEIIDIANYCMMLHEKLNDKIFV